MNCGSVSNWSSIIARMHYGTKRVNMAYRAVGLSDNVGLKSVARNVNYDRQRRKAVVGCTKIAVVTVVARAASQQTDADSHNHNTERCSNRPDFNGSNDDALLRAMSSRAVAA
jgi:hypothetical protein